MLQPKISVLAQITTEAAAVAGDVTGSVSCGAVHANCSTSSPLVAVTC